MQQKSVKVRTTNPGFSKVFHRLSGKVFFSVQKSATYLKMDYSSISCEQPWEWEPAIFSCEVMDSPVAYAKPDSAGLPSRCQSQNA